MNLGFSDVRNVVLNCLQVGCGFYCEGKKVTSFPAHDDRDTAAIQTKLTLCMIFSDKKS